MSLECCSRNSRTLRLDVSFMSAQSSRPYHKSLASSSVKECLAGTKVLNPPKRTLLLGLLRHREDECRCFVSHSSRETHESRHVQVENRIDFRLRLLWEVARGSSVSKVLVDEERTLHVVLSSFKGRFRDVVIGGRRRVMIPPLSLTEATATGDGGKKTGLIPMHMAVVVESELQSVGEADG